MTALTLSLSFVLAAGLSSPVPTAGGVQSKIEQQATATVSDHLVEAHQKTSAPRVVLTASDDERSFFDKHFPFTLDEELHPDVDQNLVAMYIVFLLAGEFVGPLWIPKLFVDLDPGPDYTSDALIDWLIHTGITVLSVFPGTYLCGTGLIGALIWAFYLNPVAYINMFNHHVIAENGMGGGGKKKRRKKSRRRDRDALLDLPSMPHVVTSANAAY